MLGFNKTLKNKLNLTLIEDEILIKKKHSNILIIPIYLGAKYWNTEFNLY